MVNFRYHVVSLVAVFLALAIGVVMGTTVIDRVLVDRLERQQDSLSRGIDRLQQERDQAQDRLSELQGTNDLIAEEGTQRLLEDTLTDVPVLVVGVRGVESDALDQLVAHLGTAGADYRGTLWFDEQLALDDEDTASELGRALDLGDGTSPDILRGLALNRVAAELQAAIAAPPADGEPSFEGTAALRSAGFVDFDPPDTGSDDIASIAVPGTRVVVVGGASASVPDELVAQPFVADLVERGSGTVPALAVAVEGEPPAEGADREATFVGPIREDDDLSDRVSTVDDLDQFAGRLATVLALQDLAVPRFGHFGIGPGATRLLPPPAPAG